MSDYDSPWKDVGIIEVASFAVLADDNPNWRPDRFGYQRWGVRAELQFPVVKLLDFAERGAELEESENPFATVVLAHLDTMETRPDAGQRKTRKFTLTRRLFHAVGTRIAFGNSIG